MTAMANGDGGQGSDEVLARVRELLSFYSGTPAAELTGDSRPDNTAGWDSAANLGLLAAIEDEFSLEIGTRDAMRLRSVGQIAEFVVERRRAV